MQLHHNQIGPSCNAVALCQSCPVPKRVDHHARRQQLAEAIWRITSSDGLEGVSLRHVAGEAGVSMGMVQHYFRTKDEMLLFALDAVSERAERRIGRVVAGLSDPEDPHQLVRAALLQLLPLDAGRTIEAQMSAAFLARAAVQPEIAVRLAEGSTQLQDFVADQIRRAQALDRADAELQPDHEAAALLAFVDGLMMHTLIRRHGPDDALAIFESRLTHLFSST